MRQTVVFNVFSISLQDSETINIPFYIVKKSLLILFLISIAATAFAQSSGGASRILVGVVKDEQGKGLPGAVVYLKDNPSIGTETDKFGNFQLKNIPQGNHKVIITMLGMTEVEILYTGQESTIVTLVEEATSIEDVVVTGIITRNWNSFSGSASTFSGQ